MPSLRSLMFLKKKSDTEFYDDDSLTPFVLLMLEGNSLGKHQPTLDIGPVSLVNPWYIPSPSEPRRVSTPLNPTLARALHPEPDVSQTKAHEPQTAKRRTRLVRMRFFTRVADRTHPYRHLD